MFYFFDELSSTIDEARDDKYRHGDVVVAEHQTAGRGQRGRVWHSPAGENLMFSVVLDTGFLRSNEQFLLLQAVALGLVDVFVLYGLDARVKWTNDIYIGDRKVVGVLIDHTLGANGMLARSGVGIGINVNQRVFDSALPNPTSMAVELGREVDRGEVLRRACECVMRRVEQLREGDFQREYHSRIYRLDELAEYELANGERFRGTIRGVRPGGGLVVELQDGTVREFLFREVSFVI